LKISGVFSKDTSHIQGLWKQVKLFLMLFMGAFGLLGGKLPSFLSYPLLSFASSPPFSAGGAKDHLFHFLPAAPSVFFYVLLFPSASLFSPSASMALRHTLDCKTGAVMLSDGKSIKKQGRVLP
jgi:uncharacterized BrkB/YihY/UPF0761 family membrane protein